VCDLYEHLVRNQQEVPEWLNSLNAMSGHISAKNDHLNRCSGNCSDKCFNSPEESTKTDITYRYSSDTYAQPERSGLNPYSEKPHRKHQQDVEQYHHFDKYVYVDKRHETRPRGKALTTVVTTINTKKVLVYDHNMEAATTTLEGEEVCKDMKEEKTESKKQKIRR